jgi:hypothetical protein
MYIQYPCGIVHAKITRIIKETLRCFGELFPDQQRTILNENG